MATAVLAPYSHNHFQSLPSLEEAKDILHSGKIPLESFVKDFKDFFVKEGMDRTFGLAMLHRHFDLEADEKLVDYQGTSTPWKSVVPGMKEPQASIWAFDGDKTLKPTEFFYSEKQDAPLSEEALAFAAKLKTKLDSLGLTNVLGLARYPGDDFRGSCEFTQGNRQNINLKPDDYPPNLKNIPTIWYFSDPLWTRGCRCTCNASSDDHGHGRHVYSR